MTEPEHSIAPAAAEAPEVASHAGKVLYLSAALCFLAPVLMFAAAMLNADGRRHELMWRAIALLPLAMLPAPLFAGAGLSLRAGRGHGPKKRLALQLVGCVLALIGGAALVIFFCLQQAI